MTEQELADYKVKVMAHFDKMKEKGIPFTKWTCPHCDKPNETVKPNKKLVDSRGYWDSTKGCYECGQPSFVKTWPNGNTEVVNLFAQTN